MTETLDLSVRVAGCSFRSPIISASSECASDPSLVSKLAQTRAGGIVTKTFTTRPEYKVRVRPYQFPLNRFGKAYGRGNCLYSLAAPHVEDMDRWLPKVSRMTEICRRASLPLIASFFEDPEDIPLWVGRAKAFEKTGASMIELNFSCPHTSKIFHRGLDVPAEIISRIRDGTSIPVGIKIGPTLEPLEPFIESFETCKVDFITAHNAPGGILIDIEKEVPFGAPSIGGYAMGRTFLPYSLARIARILRVTNIPVIGVGGIGNAADALQYLLCGCHLTGIGSALYFHGFEAMNRIHQGISAWMEKKGYQSVEDFRGKVLPLIQDTANLGAREEFPFTMPPDCPYAPVIDERACTLCGLCEKTCIYGALKVDRESNAVIVDENKCWSCGFCVGICPSAAIELRDREDRNRVIWNNEGFAAPFNSG